MISKIFQHIIVNFFALVIGSVSATGQESLTQEEVNTWFETLSNRRRRGPNDQMGTVNHITTETRIAAANLVETGVSISMAHEKGFVILNKIYLMLPTCLFIILRLVLTYIKTKRIGY